jgi:hypothetical protein
MFDNMVLEIILGSKVDVVLGGCRKLHNEELHNLHASPKTISKSRKIKWWHVARMGRKKYAQNSAWKS